MGSDEDLCSGPPGASAESTVGGDDEDVVVVGRPNAVEVAIFRPQVKRPDPLFRGTSTNARLVDSMVRECNHLAPVPLQPPSHGPRDDGSSVVLTFSHSDQSKQVVKVKTSGCRFVLAAGDHCWRADKALCAAIDALLDDCFEPAD